MNKIYSKTQNNLDWESYEALKSPEYEPSQLFKGILKKNIQMLEAKQQETSFNDSIHELNSNLKDGLRKFIDPKPEISSKFKSKISKEKKIKEKKIEEEILDYDKFVNQKWEKEDLKSDCGSQISLKQNGSLTEDKVKPLFLRQLLLDIPYIKINSYFGSLKAHNYKKYFDESKDLLDDSPEFVRDNIQKLYKSNIGKDELTDKIKKTNNFKLEKDFNQDQRLSFDTKKKLTLLGVENFGIDISLAEEFFGHKIKAKHLKTRFFTRVDSIPPSPKRIISKLNQEIAQTETGLENSNKDSNLRKSYIEMQRGKWLRTSEIREMEDSKSDGFKRMLSKSSSGIVVTDSLSRGKILYSFRDDMTIGTTTQHDNEEFEMFRVNSRSVLDMSRFDWSCSALTVNKSFQFKVRFISLIN